VNRPSTFMRHTKHQAAFWFVLAASAVLAGAAAQAADAGSLNGKVLAGYQGWFHCPDDGDPRKSWRSWARGELSPETLTVDMYPDLSDFRPQDLCLMPGFTIRGGPAYLYSALKPPIVDRHFQWMKDYGLDGVLVQRFVTNIPRLRETGDLLLKHILAAARTHGRVFAIEYDVTGSPRDKFFDMLKEDWRYLVEELKITAHPGYLRHAGRPVLSVWGMGLQEERHPPRDAATALAVVRWFKSEAPPHLRVTYMGGVPSRWRTLTADAQRDPAWAEVYAQMDIIQPWTVGRYRDLDGADRWQREILIPDLERTRELGRLYMPVVFPGFSWANLKRDTKPNAIPRQGGRFLWRQAVNARRAGASMLKIAMFDEVNEGTAIFKIAARRQDAPEQGYWLTLDADGESLPSDWYLRLAGEITRLIQGRRQSIEMPAPRPSTAVLPADVVEDKIQGGLLAQIIANLNGLAHENKYLAEPGNVPYYVPSLPEGGRTDDDTDIEWVYLFGIERRREILLPPDEIARLWRTHINRRIWCSHKYLRQLLEVGILPPLTGSAYLNPWAEFNLSGQFVSESWGLIAPGMPQTAARVAVHYIRTSVDREPLQAAQLFASMISTAFLTSDLNKILDAGAASVDPKSEMARIIADVRRWHAQYPNDWRATRRRIAETYRVSADPNDIRDRNGVKLNGAATIAALLYGRGDFVETVRHAFNFGWDADNTAATAGTIIGVIKGRRWLTSQGWNIQDGFKNTTRDGLPDETITSFGNRLIAVTRLVVEQQGGEVTQAGGNSVYRIRTQTPANVEPLPDPAQQFRRLREQLAAEIESGIRQPASDTAAARAAYLAIALELAPQMRQKYPEGWNQALQRLSAFGGLMEVLFYDSAGAAGERLRRAAREAGLNPPPRTARK